MKVNRSRQREAVLEIIRGTSRHLTANEIYQDVRKAVPKVSLGTVYRNLNLLKELGEIREIACDGRESRFDGMTEAHCHFHCYSCGDISNLYESLGCDIQKRIGRKHGLIVTDQRLEFYGYCNQCQRRYKRLEMEKPCFLKPVNPYQELPDLIKAKTINHSRGGLAIRYQGESLSASVRLKVTIESLDIYDREAEIAWSTEKRSMCKAGLSWS